MKWSALYNPMMIAGLRSPLHKFFLSGNFMVINFTGRKSGKNYSVPVEYCFDGKQLMFYTGAERNWWRNLRDGAAVTVNIRGNTVKGTTTVSVNDETVFLKSFEEAYLMRFPKREKIFNLRREADGSFNAEDVAKMAKHTVVVWVTLNR